MIRIASSIDADTTVIYVKRSVCELVDVLNDALVFCNNSVLNLAVKKQHIINIVDLVSNNIDKIIEFNKKGSSSSNQHVRWPANFNMKEKRELIVAVSYFGCNWLAHVLNRSLTYEIHRLLSDRDLKQMADTISLKPLFECFGLEYKTSLIIKERVLNFWKYQQNIIPSIVAFLQYSCNTDKYALTKLLSHNVLQPHLNKIMAIIECMFLQGHNVTGDVNAISQEPLLLIVLNMLYRSMVHQTATNCYISQFVPLCSTKLSDITTCIHLFLQNPNFCESNIKNTLITGICERNWIQLRVFRSIFVNYQSQLLTLHTRKSLATIFFGTRESIDNLTEFQSATSLETFIEWRNNQLVLLICPENKDDIEMLVI